VGVVQGPSAAVSFRKAEEEKESIYEPVATLKWGEVGRIQIDTGR